MPEVSIIIPVYNVERTLAKCLDSALTQSLQDIEIICADDGSADRSPDILKEYAARDTRIKTVFHGTNLGTHMARKHAVGISSGDYIMFLDSDDEFTPDACEKAYEAIVRADVDILQFGAEVVDCSDTSIPEGLSRYLDCPTERIDGDILEATFLGRQKRNALAFNWNLWNKIFYGNIVRSAFVQSLDGYIPRANDLYAFFFIARLAKSCAGIADKLYRCNRGMGLYGTTFHSLETFNKFLTHKHTLDLLCESCRENGEEEKCLGVLAHIEQNLLYNCLDRWVNDLIPEEAGAGLERLFTEWGVEETVAAMAARFWNNSGEAARKIAAAHTFIAPKMDNNTRVIAFYYGSIADGGAQRVTAQLCSLFADMKDAAGHPLYRVVLITDEGPLENEYPLSPLVVRRFLPHRLHAKKNDYRRRCAAWHTIIDEEAVDLVVSGHWFDDFALWDMLSVKSCPSRPAFVLYIHNFTIRPFLYENDVAARLPELYRIADGVAVLSECDRDYVRRYAQHVVCVNNPVSYLKRGSEKNVHNGRTLIWTGRIAAPKKPLDLITMMKYLITEIPDAKLIIVGQGDEELTKQMIEKTQALGLAENIEFVGFTDDVASYLQRADLYVCTSEFEGFLLSLSEALSFGLPAVMYDLPWLTLVRDGRGIVTVPQGRFDLLAKEAARLLNDPAERERLSAEGIAQINEMASVDLVTVWSRFFDEIATPAPAPTPLKSRDDILLRYVTEYQEIGKRALREKASDFRHELETLRASEALKLATARIDVRNIGADSNSVNWVDISDAAAKNSPMSWIKEGGNGMYLESSAGKLTARAICHGDGTLRIALKGCDVRSADGKRMPYWIDYTDFSLNGVPMLTSHKTVWHDKPHTLTIAVKDSDVIALDTAWRPASEVVAEKTIQERDAEIAKDRFEIAKRDAEIKKDKSEIAKRDAEIIKDRSEIAKRDAEIKKDKSEIAKRDAEIKNDKSEIAKRDAEIKKDKSEISKRDAEIAELKRITDTEKLLSARIDIKNNGAPSNDVEIVEISDAKASVTAPQWLRESGTGGGLVVASRTGDLSVRLKTKGRGSLSIALRGADCHIGGKRIPVSIDYTEMSVDGKIVFDGLMSACHDKSCIFSQETEDGQIVDLNVRWVPDSARMGTGEDLRYAVLEKHRNEDIKKRDAEITKDRSEIAKLNAEIKKDKSEIAKRDAEITKDRSEIAKRDAEIKKDRSEIAKRDAEITKDRSEIAKRDAEIKKDRSEIAKRDAEIKKDRAEITKHKAETAKRKGIPAFEELLSARIDIKNDGNPSNDVEIVEISDAEASVTSPQWLRSKGTGGGGLVVTSLTGDLSVRFRVKGSGKLSITLRGADCRIGEKRIPVSIDYTEMSVDGKIVFEGLKTVSHDKKCVFSQEAADGQIVDLHVKWVSDNVYIGAGGDLNYAELTRIKNSRSFKLANMIALPVRFARKLVTGKAGRS